MFNRLKRVYRPLVRLRGYSIVQEHAAFIELARNHGLGDVHFEEIDHIGVITINNPTGRNAISGKMMVELGEIVDKIYFDSNYSNRLHGLVITGTNNVFCSGADLRFASTVLNSPEKGYLMAKYMSEVFNTILNSKLLTVAVINGPAVGGGSELLTCTDFRLIYDNSFIQFIHSKIGAAPGWGGINRLLNIVGREKALYLLASAERINPHDALNMNLVTHVVNYHDDPKHVGIEFLQSFFSKNYAGSINAMKEVVGSHPSIIQNKELDCFKSRWFCEDNIHAINSFMKSHDHEKK